MKMSDEIKSRVVACIEGIRDGEGLQHALRVPDSYIAEVQDKAHELFCKGRYDDAAVLCRGLIALAPKRFYAHLLYADVAGKLGRDDESMEAIERARELEPDREIVRLKYGQALMIRGRLDDARSEFLSIPEGSKWAGQAAVLARQCVARTDAKVAS
jgi:predicted Zn-dependent protease